MKIGTFNIIRNKYRIWTISSILIFFSLTGILISLFLPSIRQPINLGLDFTGGNDIRIERICSNECSELSVDEIIEALKVDFNDKKLLNNIKIQIQNDSKLITVRTPLIKIEKSDDLLAKIDDLFGPLNFDTSEYRSIGPKLGNDLLLNGAITLLISLFAISIYLSIRFDRRYALLALAALFHDLFIVFGIFSWLGILLSIEVNVLFAVSLLTIAGYSVNDTVVIFDRIRENIKNNKNLVINDLIQISVNESLRRTLFTSFTTLIPLVSLMIFGSYTLFWFSVSLSLGVIVGSYSSILFAPSLLLKDK